MEDYKSEEIVRLGAEYKFFAESDVNIWLANALPVGVTIYCIVDACICGTILDMTDAKSPLVQDNARAVVSISACVDIEQVMEAHHRGLITDSIVSVSETLWTRVSCATF